VASPGVSGFTLINTLHVDLSMSINSLKRTSRHGGTSTLLSRRHSAYMPVLADIPFACQKSTPPLSISVYYVLNVSVRCVGRDVIWRENPVGMRLYLQRLHAGLSN
jgi:hypothetical protein